MKYFKNVIKEANVNSHEYRKPEEGSKRRC